MEGLEWFLKVVVVDPRMGAVVILLGAWWLERKDKEYEREQRRIEREAYERRLKEREDKFDVQVERAITNAHAMTTAVTSTKDALTAGFNTIREMIAGLRP